MNDPWVIFETLAMFALGMYAGHWVLIACLYVRGCCK